MDVCGPGQQRPGRPGLDPGQAVRRRGVPEAQPGRYGGRPRNDSVEGYRFSRRKPQDAVTPILTALTISRQQSQAGNDRASASFLRPSTGTITTTADYPSGCTVGRTFCITICITEPKKRPRPPQRPCCKSFNSNHFCLVGARRFELPTSWSRTKRSSQAELRPVISKCLSHNAFRVSSGILPSCLTCPNGTVWNPVCGHCGQTADRQCRSRAASRITVFWLVLQAVATDGFLADKHCGQSAWHRAKRSTNLGYPASGGPSTAVSS